MRSKRATNSSSGAGQYAILSIILVACSSGSVQSQSEAATVQVSGGNVKVTAPGASVSVDGSGSSVVVSNAAGVASDNYVRMKVAGTAVNLTSVVATEDNGELEIAASHQAGGERMDLAMTVQLPQGQKEITIPLARAQVAYNHVSPKMQVSCVSNPKSTGTIRIIRHKDHIEGRMEGTLYDQTMKPVQITEGTFRISISID